MTISNWLILTAALFSIGLYGLLTRKNIIGILMSVEIMLNSAALNMVIFNRFLTPQDVDGQIFSIFIIAVAAAEAVVAMGLFVAIFRQQKTVDVTRLNLLKGS